MISFTPFGFHSIMKLVTLLIFVTSKFVELYWICNSFIYPWPSQIWLKLTALSICRGVRQTRFICILFTEWNKRGCSIYQPEWKSGQFILHHQCGFENTNGYWTRPIQLGCLRPSRGIYKTYHVWSKLPGRKVWREFSIVVLLQYLSN